MAEDKLITIVKREIATLDYEVETCNGTMRMKNLMRQGHIRQLKNVSL